MAKKRPLEDESSAAGGAKKPRIEDRHDDDEEMYDVPLESDEPEDTNDVPEPEEAEEEESHGTDLPRITLDVLDYEKGNFPDRLVYVDNGKIFPGYHNPTVPTYAMPMVSEPSPLPAPLATLAAALPLPGMALGELSERLRKAVLKLPSFAIPLVLTSTPEKDEIVELFQNVKRLDGGWIGVEGRLGKGGQGCARLFVKLDDRNRITERIVVKDSFQKLETWVEENWWESGRFGIDPRESIVNKILSLPTPQRWERYIVEYLGHSINHQWKTNRTYMEYCDGGDLHKLMKAQRHTYRHLNTNYDPDIPGGEDSYNPKSFKVSAGAVIPEQFVWYYLKQMAVALHRMNNIPIRKNKGDFVVHQDIKPENIFLTNPNPYEFPRYPVCKLGDFGSARVTFPLDPDNPEQWCDAITPGYIAPEMDPHVYAATAWELSSATNVWQIAMAIVTLMRLEHPDQIKYKERDLDEEKMHSLNDLAQDYSVALRDILEEMLQTNPGARPTPHDIIEWFYGNRDEWKEMATAPTCDDFDLHPAWLHWSPSEKFQIDDLFDNVPSSPKEKKGKTKIGGLPVPSSNDEDSSDDDDEDDEHKGPLKGKGKKGVINIPDASGVHAGDEEEDDEEEDEEENEEEDEEYDKEDEEEDEDEDEDGEEDYDEDDPMEGSSGPSLTSGSEYVLPSEDHDILMEGVSRGSGSY